MKRCVYNLGGISFTPEEFIVEVKKLFPGLKVEYELCPTRSVIADNWPNRLDDTFAKEEWGLNYDITIYELAEKILDNIEDKYKKGTFLDIDSTSYSRKEYSRTNYRKY